MTDVAVRELRNNTADVIRRVQAGEEITITVNGVQVADLVPVHHRRKRRSIPKEEFLRNLRQADPGLRDDLARLAGDTTDDLDPIR